MEHQQLLAPRTSFQSSIASAESTHSPKSLLRRDVSAPASPLSCLVRSRATITPANSTEVHMDYRDESFISTQNQVASMKADVSRNSKVNFDLERIVRQFDTQIGLLISLRIAYDKEQVDRRDFGKLAVLGRGQQDKAASWPTDAQLRHYGTLFFLLQTRPHYIAKLARQVGSACIDDLLKVIMFTLYGHHYDPREEHLLLCMFELALTQEFEQAADVTCVLRQNTAITRMMTSYTRRGPGQEYLHQVLTAPIVFLATAGDNLEVDPVLVYTELVNKGMKDSNTPSGFVAAEDPDVKHLVKDRTQRLQEVLESLLGCIFRSASSVPFGIRWLCRTIRTLVHQYFPDTSSQNEAQQDRAASLVGGFFFLRYINPTIVSPAKINIKNVSTKAAHRTLTLMAKIIQKIANQVDPNSLREPYMVPFTDFISSYQMKLKDFFDQLCDVDDFHDFMQVEHFLAFTKNSVMSEVELSDIHKLHTLISKHSEKVLAVSGHDRLGSVLDELGEIPMMINNGASRATLHLCSRTTMNDDAAIILDDSFTDMSLMRDSTDSCSSADQQLKTFKTRCITLLARLFKMLPESYRTLPLVHVVKSAEDFEVQQIKDISSITELLLNNLRQNGIDVESSIDYLNMKESLPSQEELHARCRGELMHLVRIQTLVNEHFYFLSEQLETYKVYLTAARLKAVTSRLSDGRERPRNRRRSLSAANSPHPVRVNITTLRRFNVVAVCPAQRSRETIEVAMPSPGQYIFSVVGANRNANTDQSGMLHEHMCYLALRWPMSPKGGICFP
eukprot:scpid19769/ scgid2682/ GTPase-activating protein; Ras GTPase-activating protein